MFRWTLDIELYHGVCVPLILKPGQLLERRSHMRPDCHSALAGGDFDR